VQGLTYEECATLLNVDVANEAIMNDIFDTGAGGCWGRALLVWLPPVGQVPVSRRMAGCLCCGLV
jgi:hypothetical protein